jgi:hypothetical protein
MCPSVAVTQLRTVMSALKALTYPRNAASESLGGLFSNLSPLEEPRRIPQSARVRLIAKVTATQHKDLPV